MVVALILDGVIDASRVGRCRPDSRSFSRKSDREGPVVAGTLVGQ